jgi:hypothetical protein
MAYIMVIIDPWKFHDHQFQTEAPDAAVGDGLQLGLVLVELGIPPVETQRLRAQFTGT